MKNKKHTVRWNMVYYPIHVNMFGKKSLKWHTALSPEGEGMDTKIEKNIDLKG